MPEENNEQDHKGVLLEVQTALKHICADSTGDDFTRARIVADRLDALIEAVKNAEVNDLNPIWFKQILQDAVTGVDDD